MMRHDLRSTVRSHAGARPDDVLLLVIHWGRRGGGPRFHAGLVRELAQDDSLVVHASCSRQAENSGELTSLGLPSCIVDTFASGIQAGTGVVRLLRSAILLRRHVRKASIDVVV